MADQEKQKQEIPAMYGNFRVYGKVGKLDKANFNSTTKTQREKRSLTIGLNTTKDNMVYINMSAVSQNSVYFVKRDPETHKTADTKVIPWNERLTHNLPKEYVPMSDVLVGVEQTKVTTENGAEKFDNNLLHRTMFDALQEIYDHVEVGDDLFIQGSVTVEKYTKQNGEIANIVRLVPSRITKRTQITPLDLNAEDFVERNEMTQRIIPQSVDINDDESRAIINGLVIGNKKEGMIEIEIPKDSIPFAKSIKNMIQETPYMSIQLNCRIVNEGSVSQPEKIWDEDFQTYVAPPATARTQGAGTKFAYVTMVSGSKDITTYTEENVESFRNTFIRGQEEFGAASSGNQGSEDIWGSI